jgi:hypothetical protein
VVFNLAEQIVTVTQDYIGTAAERGAMVTTNVKVGSIFEETDTGVKYKWSGSAWFTSGDESITAMLMPGTNVVGKFGIQVSGADISNVNPLPVGTISAGTQINNDKTLTLAASRVVSTRSDIDITIPANTTTPIVLNFANMSRISAMSVDVGNIEALVGENRQIVLTSVSVPAAVSALTEDCEDAWDTAQGANVTCSADAVVYKVGSKSAKMAVGAAATVGLLASETISSANYSDKTHLSMWVYSSIALNEGDVQFNIDNTSACASPLESINLPAIAATTWTKVYLKLANPTSDLAIVSVGVSMMVDKGAFDLYIDDVYAIKQGTNAVVIDAVKEGTLRLGVINDTALGTTDDAYFYANAREV